MNKNYVLESNVRHHSYPEDADTVEQVRAQCKAITGSTVMPAVVYKGELIPAGELGRR